MSVLKGVMLRGRILIRATLVIAAVALVALTQARPAAAQITYINPCVLFDTTNCAAAFGWQGYVVTDLQLSEYVSADHTIMTRFMLQYPNGYQGPMLSVNGGGTYMIGQGDYRLDTDAPKLEINIGGSHASYIVPDLLQLFGFPDSLNAGQWEHLAVVRSGNTFKLYLNGHHLCADPNVYAFCDLPVTATSMPSGTLRLGRNASGNAQFYGFVDDVAVFKKALSEAEIQNINANVKRLTGGESNLYAGYTFDPATPSGQALPAKLSRPVTFQAPAKRRAVSQTRDSASDAKALPAPVQQKEMQLPFAVGQVWYVVQGWGGTASHNGYANFAWDFARSGGDAVTCKTPFYAAAGGTVIVADDAGQDIVVQHAPGEYMRYLHHWKGTLAVSAASSIQVGTHLADTGGNQNSGTTNCHLHMGSDLYLGTVNQKVTMPLAFSNYEVDKACNGNWVHVNRGVPQQGECVKRLS